MIENDIIQCILDDLIDQICSKESYSTLNYSSTKSIENQFNHSINILNNSLKQYLKYELNTVVQNGQLTTTSNIRHSRYYNPATTIKQANDLKKKLHWIHQRQFLIQQLNLNQQQKIHQINCDVNSMENIWFDQRFKILDQSMNFLQNQSKQNEINSFDEYSCARCRIYQRKITNKSNISFKLKQIHHEHNYFNKKFPNSSSTDFDLLETLSKLADQIGQNLSPRNSLKKLPSSIQTQTTLKKKQPKLQTSISLIVTDTNKTPKRTIDDSKPISNSNFISNHFDITNKRQKRIASPQSSFSVSSSNTTAITSNISINEILTPTCRLLNKIDYDLNEKYVDQQDIEDISDESFIRRHIRCELEQETWLKNPTISKNIPVNSNRKTNSLQTSLSVPNGSPTTTTNHSKQYRYHVTENGIAYTETIDSK